MGIMHGQILQLLNDFVLGRVDIAAIITLIPKVKGADTVKQFRPIGLIKVIFKFVVKAFAIRLAPLVHRTIDHSQTTFISGRCLHEGLLALHEIAHELKAKRLGAFFSSSTLRNPLTNLIGTSSRKCCRGRHSLSDAAGQGSPDCYQHQWRGGTLLS
jgi:hypothetical protein